MKMFKSLVIAVISLVSINVSAQSVDEVVDKYVAALGGKEKLNALKSVKMSGNMATNGQDVSITTTKLHGVGMRMDLEIMGSNNYQLVNTKTGWAYFPVAGMAEPKEMDAEQFKNGVNQLDVQGALFNYKEKGTTVELQGQEEVAGSVAHKVKLTYKNGHSTTYFIDSKTGRHLKSVSSIVVNGNPTVTESTFTDYKQNDAGYWFPYTIATSQGTITFDKIETNMALKETDFNN